MSSDHFIFVGFERTEQVKGLLDACEERDRVYLDDPTYLENLSVDDRQFVGKRIKDGAALDRIEDTARSVVSLLARVNPKWTKRPDAALILALEDDGVEGAEPANGDDDGFDYAELVD